MDGPFPPDLVPAWERLLASGDLSLDPVSGLCEAIFNDPVVFPLQRRRELAQMLAVAKAQMELPRIVLEIGADKGGGVAHWCMLPGVECVIACEIRGTPYTRLFESVFPHILFHWMEGSSRSSSVIEHVAKRIWGQQIDVVFLDGDKSEFLADFDTWRPLIRDTGVVFMHDIQDDLPGRAFDAIRARGYRTRTIIDTSESVEASKRAAAGEPVATAHEGWLRHWAGRSCGVGVIWMKEGLR